MKKRMLFVFNPKAGKGRIKTHLLDIVDIFNKGGYEVIIRATQGPKDAYEQVKEYADQVDLIACSGGDGTLDEVVTGIVEVGSQTPIGYIPAGSTNDFANSLFMPKSMTAAASMIMEEQIYHCDIGKFNNQTFAYVAAFGLFTNVSYETDQDLKNIHYYIRMSLLNQTDDGYQEKDYMNLSGADYDYVQWDGGLSIDGGMQYYDSQSDIGKNYISSLAAGESTKVNVAWIVNEEDLGRMYLEVSGYGATLNETDAELAQLVDVRQ